MSASAPRSDDPAPQPVDPPAVDSQLLAEDARTGRALTFMLSGLFLYTIIAMSVCVYLTWQWTR